MGWESSGMVGFDLRPLLEGEMRTAKLKSAYNSLIIGPRGFGALSLRWIQFRRTDALGLVYLLFWLFIILDPFEICQYINTISSP